ncbi:MAG: RNA-binding protein [Parachlamydiales bacterium]|jgi:RNA recognition motif-containing protein
MSNEKNKLFIGNLSWKAGEEDLRPLFEQHGAVLEVKVVMDNYTGKSRGFAFVIMGSPEEAQAAIENLDKMTFLGRELRVSLAEDRRQNKEPREGGYQRRENGGGNGYNRSGGGDRDNYRGERSGGYAGSRQR